MKLKLELTPHEASLVTELLHEWQRRRLKGEAVAYHPSADADARNVNEKLSIATKEALK